MMEIYVAQQGRAFLGMLVCGIGFGLVFDFFRALRKTFSMKALLVGLSDLLFWLICTGLVFVSIRLTNRGELRMFGFLGFFFGISAYFLIFGSYLAKWMSAGIGMVLRLTLILLRILSFPFRVVAKPLSKWMKKGKRVWKKATFIYSVKRQKQILFRRHLKKILKSPKFF